MSLRSFCLLLAWVGLPGLLILLYAPGSAGSFHFDDQVNLWGLEEVVQREGGFWWFVLSGHHLPFGRALALLTFAWQAEAWARGAAEFLWVNIGIHALNGLLVAFLCFQLARCIPALDGRAAWVGLTSGLLWGILPIHAPATLMIIQRMSTLSAIFGLLAVITYVLGRRLAAGGNPEKGWTLVCAGVPVLTLIGMAAKESAVLIPLYCLVLEGFFFSALPAFALSGRARQLVGAARIVGLLAVFAFLILLLPYWLAGYQTRDFTLGERLLSQPRVLFQYLALTLAPRSSQILPFHDDLAVSHSLLDPVTTLPAVLGLLAVPLLAWFGRRRMYLFALGVFWFLAGHLLESSVVSLEMYFDHRNYLPLVIPVFACVSAVFLLPDSSRRLALGLLGVFVLLYGASLGETARLWGEPLVAASVWQEQHPASERANIFLAQQQAAHGELEAAFDTLARAADARGDALGLQVAALQTGCVARVAPELLRERYHRTLRDAAGGAFSHAASGNLVNITRMVRDGECPGLSLDEMQSLLDALVANPAFSARPAGRVDLAFARATLFLARGALDRAEAEYRAAIALQPTVGLIVDLARLLHALGRIDEAHALLVSWQEHPPVANWLRDDWRRAMQDELDRLKERST